MQTKRQLMMSVTCTLALVVNGAGAFAQGTPPERVRVAEGPNGVVRVETANVQILPSLDGLAYQIVQGGGGRGGGTGPQVTYSFEGTEFSFGGKVVKGAPYSADAITETVQTLSDGNRIVRHTASKVYRDGEGRERREQSLNAVGPWTASNDQVQSIFINDPVSGVNYTLYPEKQVAVKSAATGNTLADVRNALTAGVGSGGRGGAAGTMVSGGGRGGSVTAYDLGVAAGEAEKARLEKMKAEAAATGNASTQVVISGSRGGGAGAVAAGGRGGMAPALAVSGGTYATTMRFEPKTESLGKQMIGNVEAEGTRTTITIPAGAIGNESPIDIVNERWYSPELQVVVMTKNSDPRTGENTYRLTNILRSEPAPSLFQVPSDYKVTETTMRIAMPAMPVPTIKKQENDK